MTTNESAAIEDLSEVVGDEGDTSYVETAAERDLTEKEREAVGGSGMGGNLTMLRIEFAEFKRRYAARSFATGIASGVATGIVSNPHVVLDLLRMFGMGV